MVALLLPGPAMESWGWRIPFLLAIPLAALVLYLRLQVEDSPEYVASKAEHRTTDKPIAEVFRHYKAPLAKVISISLVQNIGTYVGTVFVAVYFSNVLGFSKAAASTIVLVAVLIAAVLIPVCGLLGTRIGAKRLLTYSYLAYLVITIPSFVLMNQHSVGLAMLGLALGMIPYALCQAGTYSIIPEFYPVKVRHTGVAFGHSVGAVVGGGGGPYLATWLSDATGSTFIPAYILIFAGALGLAVISLAVRRNTAPGASHLYR
jgi:MHS family proline/betaine transporter-like MFS transporter